MDILYIICIFCKSYFILTLSSIGYSKTIFLHLKKPMYFDNNLIFNVRFGHACTYLDNEIYVSGGSAGDQVN